jgi:hypothetical protein
MPFEQEIINFIEAFYPTAQIVNIELPFHAISCQKESLLIHLISLPAYQKQEVSTLFFRQISSEYIHKNIKVIHLWEDVYRQKPLVVQSRLKALLGISERIHGRLCEVRRIDKTTANVFLQENHLQGFTNAKFKYGLFLKPVYANRYVSVVTEPLVAVATFAGMRTMRDGRRSGELIRFASVKGTTVIGGLDKILKAFIREHQPNDIMTYADRDWSDGHSYETIGFKRIEDTVPQLFYLDTNTNQRYYPSQISGDDSTFLKIYNAGNIKYRWQAQ